jgi:hypothetical protein
MSVRSGIRGAQVKDDSLTGDDIDESTLVVPVIKDADGDTRVDCEETGDEDKIRFDTAGVERMIIDDSGKVGIGTDAPQTTLHVKAAVSQFRVEDTTVDYAYTVDCEGPRIDTHFGDLTDGESGKDAFMSFGAYSGINRLDTAFRDFHLYGSRTTVGFYFDESEGMFGIAKSTPGSTLDINGSVSLKVNGLKTSDYTIAADDHTVVADCGSGNVTLTLPSATDAMAGRIYVIKRTDTSNHGINTLTIDPAGSNIDGAGSDKIMAHLDALVLQCIGQSAGWILIGSYMAPI